MATPSRSSTPVSGVSRETLERINHYMEVLRTWQKRMNLLSQGSDRTLVQRHVEDSLQLTDFCRPGDPILDMGSGGGFPGLVLACAKRELGVTVHLVESNTKKCAFLKTVGRELALDIVVHNKRLEGMSSDETGPIGTVTARALAPLDQLFEYAKPWMQKSARCVFLKGVTHMDELGTLSDDLRHRVKTFPSTSGNGAVIVYDEKSEAVTRAISHA